MAKQLKVFDGDIFETVLAVAVCDGIVFRRKDGSGRIFFVALFDGCHTLYHPVLENGDISKHGCKLSGCSPPEREKIGVFSDNLGLSSQKWSDEKVTE